jgi:dTDP-glucose 4,6-dehydratase
MLIRGNSCRAWNVGGVEALSIAELAERVKRTLGCTNRIRILNENIRDELAEIYVPNVTRALSELELPAALGLDNAILRTADWVKESGRLHG